MNWNSSAYWGPTCIIWKISCALFISNRFYKISSISVITANTQEMYHYSSVLLLVFPNKTLLTLWLSPLPLCFSLLWPRNASEEFYSKFLFSPMGIWTLLVTWLKHFNTLPLIFIYFSFFFSPFVSIYLGHVSTAFYWWPCHLFGLLVTKQHEQNLQVILCKICA